ncbi:hypothetical protein KXD40_008894 [Peronospora effusa]|uniref:Microsomal glutathione S-transferase 1 n=1 Tax=Peronospora effusa TaxID=542832 RepID=A0A3M6VNJ6_9STRA|nr:hypothetical protein DD238_005471 [Peronospora effusa]UIZ22016.1 hypothetical protein KXD40_008894 [Peronospora effusa]
MVSESVKVYVACTSVLYLKFLMATLIQGMKKYSVGGRPPEDMKISTAKVKQTFGFDKTKDVKTLESSKRWGGIVMNDLESIPFGLLIFGAGIMVGANSIIHYCAMIAFTTVRCLHTYAYANAMQPMRGLCYGVGLMATLIGLGNALSAIF